MSKSVIRTLLSSSALVALGLLTINTASAQAPAPAAQAKADTELAEVLVTARKREESIVDVPLAISVVDSVQMQRLDIRGTGDLAKYVPGLEFNDFTQGNSRNDRGQNRPLIFRGLNLGLGGSVVAAGGMFLDGAAVVGNEVPGSLDIGAVEILRGPQSVYFGRSAMTGAVSYRTKDIPEEWGITANFKAAQRSDTSFEASVAGRVLDGKLGLRLTGLTETSNGYTVNDYNGGTLGDRSRNSISGTLQFMPNDRVDVKLYANQFKDDDGASATVFLTTPISLSGPNSCKQPLDPRVPAPFSATIIRSTICGEIPLPSAAGTGIAVNYHNTSIPTALLTHANALLPSPISIADSIFASPLLAGEGFKNQVGLQRKVFNSHLTANFKLTDYLTLQWISGYHTNVSTNASDGVGSPIGTFFQYNQYFYTLSGRTKDTSHELRLTSDPTHKFSWTIGTNYVDGWSKNNAIVAFLNQRSAAGPAGAVLNPFTYTPFPQNVNTQFAKTNGIFVGGYLKMLDDKLTLSAEVRGQRDKRTDQSQNIRGVFTAGPFNKTFDSTTGRLSVDYDVGGNKKIYSSWAPGTRPGGFNANLFSFLNTASPTYNPTVAAQITTLVGVTDVSYKEEDLSIIELGYKGYLANGKGYFDVNVYSGKLKNQQVGNGTLIPALGFTVTAITNIGETKIKGVEFQGNYNFTRELSLGGALSWNNAVRTKFLSTGGQAQFGTIYLDGKKMALAPEQSGSLVLSYEQPKSDSSWSYFTNGALVYRGKMFADAGNLSWIKARMQIDYRVGAARDKYRVEAFLTNVFDNQDYTGGNVATDFGGSGDSVGSYSGRGYGFFGGIAAPRQLGLRLSATF
jgi:iron complex outermembrane receptor protein